MPAYNASSAMTGQEAEGSADETQATDAATESEVQTGELPQQVAALPSSNPAVVAKQGSSAPDATNPPAETEPTATADSGSAPSDNEATTSEKQSRIAAVDPTSAGDGSVATAATAIAEPVKPKGIFAAFFGSGGNKQQVPTVRSRDGALPTSGQVAKAAPKAVVVAASARKSEPAEIDFSAFEQPTKRTAAVSGGDNALPGVRQSALFEIKRRSGLDDDADVDIYEEEDYGPVRVASAAGMARLTPNGLQVQTESVDVACLKPSLVRVLKEMERHYGKKMVVTSGYRSPQRNRRARGAKNSLHMYCAAADIQIPGVGKWELASYARSMTGRGGVGTYCHTNSVHVDVGPERDWNWRCRGRRG